jgi:hypothetical protein
MAQDNAAPDKEPPVVDSLEMEPEPAINPQAQPGIQNIEAVTMVWSTSALIAAYTMIWLIYFVEDLVAGTQTALTPYVTSAFAEHSLTPTISIVSYVIGGVTNFTIAKILDVFGRPQGLLLCIIIASLGLVMMASCKHVEAYAAALVFYTVGNTGLQYTLSVFVADTSSLRNRGLITAFSTSQNMITCWLGGPIANAFLKGPGWAWAFGMFSILVPAFSLPLFGLFWFSSARRRSGIWCRGWRVNGRSGNRSCTTVVSLMLLVWSCCLLKFLSSFCRSVSTTCNPEAGLLRSSSDW